MVSGIGAEDAVGFVEPRHIGDDGRVEIHSAVCRARIVASPPTAPDDG
jgi:hypothetical protein